MRSFVPVLALMIASSGLCACELIADFDRGKLDAGAPPDAGLPTGQDDAGPEADPAMR
jgi:hypothetical protein